MKQLWHTARQVATWTQVGLLTPAYLGPGLLVTLLSQKWGQHITRHWAETLLRRWQIRVETVDPNGYLNCAERSIFVHLNQTSLLEAVLWPAVIQRRMGRVLNIEFALIPWVGWTLAMQDAFVIVRQSPKQAKSRLAQAVRYLRAGGNLILSIEGRRSPDGRLGRYKKGPVVMALEAGAKLIPVSTHGLRECLPVGAWRVKPGKVRVIVHEPIETTDFTYVDREQLVAKLKTVGESALGQR